MVFFILHFYIIFYAIYIIYIIFIINVYINVLLYLLYIAATKSHQSQTNASIIQQKIILTFLFIFFHF